MDASTPAPVALDELLQHRAWVTSLALGIAGNAQDAADLEQETWLSALANPPAERTSLRGWLRTVARRCAGRMRRTDDRRAAREARSLPRGEAPPAALLAERADVHRRIVAAVLALSEPSRETILLRYFEGLSVREVARVSGVPLETARARLRRGLVQLRERLGHDGSGRRVGWRAVLVPLIGTGSRPDGGYPLSALGTLGGGTMSWTLQSKIAVSALGAVGLLACGTAMDGKDAGVVSDVGSAAADVVVQDPALGVGQPHEVAELTGLPHGGTDPLVANDPVLAADRNGSLMTIHIEQVCRPTAQPGPDGKHPATGNQECLDCHVTSGRYRWVEGSYTSECRPTMPEFHMDPPGERGIYDWLRSGGPELADAVPNGTGASFFEHLGAVLGRPVVVAPGAVHRVAGAEFDGLPAKPGRRALEVLRSFCEEIGVEAKVTDATVIVHVTETGGGGEPADPQESRDR